MPLKEQPVNEHRWCNPSRLDYCRRELHTADAAVTACHVTSCTANAIVTAYQAACTALACTAAAAATIKRLEVGDSVKISDHFVSKNVLADLTMDDCHDQTLRVYAILNKQPDSTPIDGSALEFFGQKFPAITYNRIPTDPSNITNKIGRQVSGLKVKGVLNNNIIPLNDVLSINKLTDSRAQVATPKMALMYEHTVSYADQFPPFDSNARVALFIGINNEKALDTHVPSCTGRISSPALH